VLNRSIVCLALLGASASAQPAPPQPPPNTEKLDAKQLMQSGVKLFEAKDYLSALSVFKAAYQRFPSAKILLNIGTTLVQLDRKADAANAYQRYLDSPDADAAKRAEVEHVLADLDKSVGVLQISITPPDAEVQITDEWLPAPRARVFRVVPGPFKVSARKQGFKDDNRSATIIAGEKSAISIKLEVAPEPEVKRVIVEVPVGGGVALPLVEEGPRSRFGAVAGMHVSVVPKIGSAVLVGATADATSQLSIEAALMLGPGLVSKGMATLPPPSYGVYLGASFAFLPGAVRPRASFALPVFFSDGARFSVRGSGGIEYVANRHWSVLADLGFEYELNPESDIRNIAVVPALGISGRL
jgi:hypothetical protein